ncbi:MAG: hypothetical protein AB8H47_05905 [Bacteroidia bacterium]
MHMLVGVFFMLVATPPYSEVCQEIKQNREKYALLLRTVDQDEQEVVYKSAGRYLRQALVNDIVPYWLGTPWDFNGYTNVPGEGLVACGYLVSTTLKHAGLTLNRYHVAQSDATTITKVLSDTLIRFGTLEPTLRYIASQPDELYIVGMSNHVGFLYKSGDTLDFIHSSFVSPGTVVREDAYESPVLRMTNVYVLGPLTQRQYTIRKWLQKSEFTVRR